MGGAGASCHKGHISVNIKSRVKWPNTQMYFSCRSSTSFTLVKTI